ncbi:glutamyl endopeptidase [Natronobacillus azotifigens]|uniref:Serine protease n=1 Tax=Natronobacillus azotifigens TaxID=472978 RepID=A0A9J6REK3_9BACI|nr:trypsin-like peptidase domain-containing protein [Natronobacillus azotifigens]MCZ0704178.1 trypsin-like peptidase domain-containing protein [Natronobacillus azotifigens]
MKKLIVLFTLCSLFIAVNVMEVSADAILEIEPLISLGEAEKLDEIEIDSGPPSVNRITTKQSRQELLKGEIYSPNLLQQLQQEFSPQVVIGPDNRLRVSDTTIYPYSSVVQLIMHWEKDFIRTVCSGTLIDANSVATSAHCVIPSQGESERRGNLQRVEIIPARNGSSAPFGIAYATNIYAPQEYRVDRTSAFDFAVVNVNLDFSAAGSMMVSDLTSDVLLNNHFTISGYPGDKATELGNYFQWYHSGPITGIQDWTFRYQIDTFSGQSGSAVYYNNFGDITIGGIHSAGSVAGQYNVAHRITQASRNYMLLAASMNN